MFILECFTKSSDWKTFIHTKENLAIKIKEIVENEDAGFAFPSQSLYIETMPLDKTEIFNHKNDKN